MTRKFLSLCFLLLAIGYLFFGAGCAYQVSKLYDPATGNLAGKSRTFTLWDSQSSLAHLHINTVATTNAHGTFSPGISISGLNQEATSTNINALFEGAVRAAVSAAIQSAK